MKISGIVCEYNPFHNGHMYHIEQTRKNGATHIISVMSGNFVQRGDTAVIDKFKRAETAVKCGCDLVAELPFPYAVSGAENFAKGAVCLLDAAGCVDEISFGSESGDIKELMVVSSAIRECSAMPEMKSVMETGVSYPAAVSGLVRRYYGDTFADILDKPNNVLGISYINALDFFKSSVKPFAVSRNSVMHDSNEICGDFASASYIRQKILSGEGIDELCGLMPEISADMVKNSVRADIKNLERVILYRLRTADRNELAQVPDVAHGLENRIISSAGETSLENLFMAVKSKRYTMARIRRIILNALMGIRKSDLEILPPYFRVLAMNKKGAEILNIMKKTSRIPFSVSLLKLSRINKDCKRFAQTEALSTDIYNLALNGEIKPCGMDYRTKITITE